MLARGRISAANAPARALGVAEGQACDAALACLARAAPRCRSPPSREAAEARTERALPGAARRVVLVDSASLVRAEDAGAVVVTASHGGLVGGDPAMALRTDAFAALFNDAGIGIEQAGIGRLRGARCARHRGGDRRSGECPHRRGALDAGRRRALGSERDGGVARGRGRSARLGPCRRLGAAAMIERYSDHAANERTFLAWVRSAIAVMAFGFVVEKFDLFLAIAGSSPERHRLAGRLIGDITGLALIVLGGAMIVLATIRFRRTARAIESPEIRPGTGTRMDTVLVGLLVLLGAALFVYLAYTVISRL